VVMTKILVTVPERYETCITSLENTIDLSEGENTTAHRFFHLVPIVRKKVINPTSVGGGQM